MSGDPQYMGIVPEAKQSVSFSVKYVLYLSFSITTENLYGISASDLSGHGISRSPNRDLTPAPYIDRLCLYTSRQLYAAIGVQMLLSS